MKKSFLTYLLIYLLFLSMQSHYSCQKLYQQYSLDPSLIDNAFSGVVNDRVSLGTIIVREALAPHSSFEKEEPSAEEKLLSKLRKIRRRGLVPANSLGPTGFKKEISDNYVTTLILKPDIMPSARVISTFVRNRVTYFEMEYSIREVRAENTNFATYESCRVYMSESEYSAYQRLMKEWCSWPEVYTEVVSFLHKLFLTHALYNGPAAFLPLIATGDRITELNRRKSLYEQRLSHSILFVAINQEVRKHENPKFCIEPPHWIGDGSYYSRHGRHHGERRFKAIPFNLVRYILVPQELYELVVKVFKGRSVKVIPVGNVRKDLIFYSTIREEIIMGEGEGGFDGMKFSSVPETMKVKRNVLVPDYESALLKIFNDHASFSLVGHITSLPVVYPNEKLTHVGKGNLSPDLTAQQLVGSSL